MEVVTQIDFYLLFLNKCSVLFYMILVLVAGNYVGNPLQSYFNHISW